MTMAHSSSPLACSLYKLRCVIFIYKLREWKQVIYLDYWSTQIPPAQHFIHMLIGQVHLQLNCHASLLLCTFSLHFPSISYVQSSGQLILRTQLLSNQACNHMNVKKGIQLLLLLAIHRHTTESAERTDFINCIRHNNNNYYLRSCHIFLMRNPECLENLLK